MKQTKLFYLWPEKNDMVANEILFERKLNDGKPLFENQTTLASEIVKFNFPKLKLAGPSYTREVAKTKSLISGLLSPNQKRKIHPQFIEALEHLIVERTKDSTLASDLILQIRRDLKLLQLGEEREFITSDALITEMALAIRNAKNVVLFLYMDPIKADDVEDSTHIVDEILRSIKNVKFEKKRFEFYFPQMRLIDRFWISLYEKLIRESVISSDKKGIEFIQALNASLIKVYVADKSLFGVNVCITDFSETSSKYRKGFVFFESSDGKCNLTRMNGDSISQWGENVKFQVDTYREKYSLEEIKFEARLPIIFPGVTMEKLFEESKSKMHPERNSIHSKSKI